MLSKKILLAYDGSEQAKRALAFAAELATAAKAKIGVVSVVPVHAGRVEMNRWEDERWQGEELLEARRLITEFGTTPKLHEPYGEVAEEIVRTATDGGYDHIVTGSRHLGLVARTLHGSVSGAVATRFPATVTIIHYAPRAAR